MDPLLYDLPVIGVIVSFSCVLGVFSAPIRKTSSARLLQTKPHPPDGKPNIRVTLRTVCTHPHPRVVRALLDRPLRRTAV